MPDSKREQLVAGVCGDLDYAACLPRAPFRVEVLNGWEHGPSDALGHLHHPLESLEVGDGAIPILGHDATSQDALDGAAVVFGEDPAWHAEFLQPP